MQKRKIAVIGGGPAGFFAALSAYEADVDKHLQIDIFEQNIPLKTVLYTGNGRCNLSNGISDFKELASHYPRGEKFLYSVFSKFGVSETLEFFNSRGVRTYTQDDNRIFPTTDKAATVKDFLLTQAAKFSINIIKTSVINLFAKDNKFIIEAKSGNYDYESVIISTGGNRNRQNNGYKLANKLGHSVTELKPSLTSMITEQKFVKELAGVSVKNAHIQAFFTGKKVSSRYGDFIFTHSGLSGPAIFDTSAYCSFLNYSGENPLKLKINFLPDKSFAELEFEKEKSAANALKKYLPRSLAVVLLNNNGINHEKNFSSLSEKEKKVIEKILFETEIEIISPAHDGEIVTAGGIELKEINSSTMESKIVKNLFFCGEILDIDGLTGGFNLQMCWSTGHIAGISAVKNLNS